tara:strand:- start:945 stop:1475 length:531 start_codon:yes stop_codon:yes gene_type:complete
MEECRAVEAAWNTFIDDYYVRVDDKYPDTDMTMVDTPSGTIIRNVDGTTKKRSDGSALYLSYDINQDPVELTAEEVSAIRLKGHKHSVTDDLINHSNQIIVNTGRIIVGHASGEIPLEDSKEDLSDADRVTRRGLNSALAAGKVTLRTHEGHYVYADYVKREVIIDDVWGRIPEVE